MKRLYLTLIAFTVLGTFPVLALECDDDDDAGCVGLFVYEDFEITQGQVFEGLEDGVRVRGLGNLTMSGGEALGGSSDPAFAGDGIDLDQSGRATITGGTVVGTDDGIKIKENGFVAFIDGTVQGGDDGISLVEDARIEISGGEISGDVHGLLSVDRATSLISGGTISGSIDLRDDSSLVVHGGTIPPIRAAGRSIVKVMGGEFTGSIETRDDSIIAVFRDPVTGNLLDGSEFGDIIDRPRDTDAVAYHLTAVSEDTTYGSGVVENVGVIDGNDGEATTIDVDGGQVYVLYLAENSIANLNSGNTTSVTADDNSTLNVANVTVDDWYGTGAILATANATVNVTDGLMTSFSDGMRLRGRSNTSILGGGVRGRRDGLDVSAFASVTVDGAAISGDDDGIRVKDDARVTVLSGNIVGDDDGISATGSSHVSVAGGRIAGQALGIRITDDASVSVGAGGEVSGNISVKGNGIFELSGGMIEDDVVANDSTQVLVSQGLIQDDLRATDASFVNFAGGTIQGDLELRDDTRAEISGGQINNRIQAQERAFVRVFGNDLSLANDVLTGSLLDGTEINTSALTLDDARIIPYEAETSRTQISELREQNIAVFSDGAQVNVDFLAASDVTGELLVRAGGRANIIGGSLSDPLVTQDDGIVAFYGSQFTRNHVVGATVIRGTLVDGNQVDYTIHHEGFDRRILLYEAIREDRTLASRPELNVALFDGTSGGTTVDFVGNGNFYSTLFDVRETSTLNIVSGTIPNVALWDRGSVNMTGGLIDGFDEAIFARDASTVTILDGELSGFRDGIRAWDDSTLFVHDGSITAADDAIDVKQSATAMIYGGVIEGGDEGIKAKDNSIVSVFGGSIQGMDNGISLEGNSQLTLDNEMGSVTGEKYGILAADDAFVQIRKGLVAGSEGSVRAMDSSLVEIFGGEFQGDFFASGGTFNIFGTDLQLDGTDLSGFLQDGTEINLSAFTADGGEFILSPPLELACDFNGDFRCDLTDIDELLYVGLASGDAIYDLDESGSVDLGDRDEWLRQTNSEQGDFDFDGDVDAGDLNALGTRWTANDLTSYAQGDSNGDGIAGALDLNFLAGNWNAGNEPAAAVPEPNGLVLMLLGAMSLLAIRRQPK